MNNDLDARVAALPAFADPLVQIVYELVSDSELVPPEGEHWDGYVARHIVAALRAELQKPANFLKERAQLEAEWVELKAMQRLQKPALHEPVAIARVIETDDFAAEIGWILNPCPPGTLLYEGPQLHECVNIETVANNIQRDLCELEPYNPEAEDAICCDLVSLQIILQRNLKPFLQGRAQPAQEEITGALTEEQVNAVLEKADELFQAGAYGDIKRHVKAVGNLRSHLRAIRASKGEKT